MKTELGLFYHYFHDSIVKDCVWPYFRYDARLYFTDKAQFITKPSDLASTLTPEEEEIERLCDEERYMDLQRDMAEHEIQQGNLHYHFAL